MQLYQLSRKKNVVLIYCRTEAMPYSMADRSMSTSSPFISGIFFFLLLGREGMKHEQESVQYLEVMIRNYDTKWLH